MLDLINVLDGCEIAGVNVPPEITKIIGGVITAIQWGVPIVLVIFGSMDMFKAIASQKDEEIKKAQGTLLKRVMYAAIVFLIVPVLGLVIDIVGGGESMGCLNSILG